MARDQHVHGSTLQLTQGGTALGSVRSMVSSVCAALRRWPEATAMLNACWQLRSATTVGKRVRLWGRSRIVNRGTMAIADKVRLEGRMAPVELVTLPGGRLEIGSNVFINYGSSICASTHVKIGNGCLIGTHVQVMDTDFHRIEDKAYDPTAVPIVLEDRVWLANRAIVLKGVTMGHDSVVAAGSVVSRNVPPRTVVAGAPARVVRHF